MVHSRESLKIEQFSGFLFFLKSYFINMQLIIWQLV